jgi:hypothetical protein
MPGCEQNWRGTQQAARVYNHILTECAFVDEEMKDKVRVASAKMSLQSQIEEAESEDLGSSVAKVAKETGKLKRKKVVSVKALQFICAGNITPRIVELPEFNDFVHALDPKAELYSASSFRDKFIPTEAS